MFKSWKSDKNTIKAVFRLQFQVTQVPKLKKPAVTVSLVPDNIGKPTVKLDKAVVQDGSCAWEDPIYETVKLVRESKTGKIHEKIYHFIVSAGSSKAGFLGEASVDFADFAEQTKPMTLSLPLKFANSGAVLHVTIQKVQSPDQREVEENGVRTSDRSLQNQLSNCSTDDNSQLNYFEDEQLDDSFQQVLERRRSVDASPVKKNNAHRRSQTEWSLGSASDGSFGDSNNNFDEHIPRERRREYPDDSIKKLKNEIDSLTRQSALSELELQSLRKQIAKETKKGQTLLTEVNSLKEERDELKRECEELRSSALRYEEAETSRALRTECEETRAQLDELRYELDHERGMKANLRLQLQKIQDSNSELIQEIAELEEAVKEKDREISSLTLEIKNLNDLEEIEKSKDGLHQERADCSDDAEVGILKQKIVELSSEIDICTKQKEELETYLEQLSHDFEVLKQENADISARCEGSIGELEAHIEKLEEVVKTQAEELSEASVSISELESQLKGLEREMDQQARGFEEELEAMSRAKVEQEQRAIRAEEALRNTRWKNAVTAERLQEEFKRLSVEMTSKFDENEKMAANAVAEANELRQQKRTLEEMLQKANEELRLTRDHSEVKLRELYDQIACKAMQVEQKTAQLDTKGQQLEDSRKENEQITKAFSTELQSLSSEIEALRTENCKLKEQCERAKKLREETDTEMLTQRWNAEREDLLVKFTSAKKDAEETAKKSEAEVQSLMARHDDLKQNLSNEEAEKEKLRKQIHKLQGELRKRGEEAQSFLYNSKEVAMLKEKLGLLKEQIGLNSKQEPPTSSLSGNEDSLIDIISELERSTEHLRHSSFSASTSTREVVETEDQELVTELKVFKERNRLMEKELKDMEERYSEISLRFAEVEGERQQLVMAVRNLKNSKKS